MEWPAAPAATMLPRLLLITWCALLCGCLTPLATPVTSADAPPADPPAAQPKADPDAVLAISYDDLDLPMEPDTLFEDWMLTQRVRDLDGKRVRITGFMLPGFDSRNVRQFMMLREKECPYGIGGQAHHVIAVSLKHSATYTTSAVTVEGTLLIRPFTGYNDTTWALYALDDASLK